MPGRRLVWCTFTAKLTSCVGAVNNKHAKTKYGKTQQQDNALSNKARGRDYGSVGGKREHVVIFTPLKTVGAAVQRDDALKQMQKLSSSDFRRAKRVGDIRLQGQR